MMKHLSARSSRLSLLLLLLLAPGVGLATQESPAPEQQPPPASSGMPGTQERTAPRLSEDAWAQDEASHPPRGLRILAETGAGLLTSVGGGFIGLQAGSSLCEALDHSPGGGWLDLSCLGGAVLGSMLGAGAGFSLGVWWGGELAGGDGKVLGALAGFGAGVVLLIIADIFRSLPVVIAALPVVVIGSVVGYELTQRAPAPGPQAPAVASAHPRLQPVLAFSTRGALVGLGGSF